VPPWKSFDTFNCPARHEASRTSVDGNSPGREIGHSILQICFNDLGAHRVDLLVHMENDRARRVYARIGFFEEGILRDYHRAADGSFHPLRLMSLLRPDWQSNS
jgi:RimJ/RimL family protein N-acetyltransferase